MQTPTLLIPGTPPASLQTFRALIRTFGLLKRVMEPHFTAVGVSGTQWAILRTLHDVEAAGESPVRLSELGNRLLVRPPSVTGLVRRLQQLGLIDVSASAVDARAKTVSLTDAGRRLVESFAERHAERIEQVMSGLDAGERDELLRLLTQLGGHLERVAASDGDGERRRRQQSEHPIAAEKRNSRCGC